MIALPRFQKRKERKKERKRDYDKFVFRVNDYYLDLINWEDPDDPIRKIVIPNTDEDTNYVVPGCQHKYETTALSICSEVCGAYCRYCFRKRLFCNDVKEVMADVEPGLDYIRKTLEINNVLLTGGDSLILAARRLDMNFTRLREIEHVKIIRVGSKLPVFNPMSIHKTKNYLMLLKNIRHQKNVSILWLTLTTRVN